MWLSGLRKAELIGVIRASFAQLNLPDQRRIRRVAAAQILLGFLDLLGIAIVGLVASLAVTGINSKSPTGLMERVLHLVNLDSLSFQWQTAILAFIALCTFICRSLLSMFFIQKTLKFLGRCGAEITSDLFGKVLSQSLSDLNKSSPQQYLYSLTSGVEVITLRIIGSTVTLIADATLLIFLFVALVFVDLPMTIIATLVVGLMSWVLYRLTTAKSKILGQSYSTLDISSRETLIDAITAYREIAAKGRFGYFEREFRRSRLKVSSSLAEYNLMPYTGKYVIETSIIIAAFLVAGAQFVLTDAVNAITTLSIFMAAGSRLAPAVLRIQQGMVGLNNGWGIAESTLKMIEDVKHLRIPGKEFQSFSTTHKGFNPIVELKNVSFKYPLSSSEVISMVSLTIEPGESVAIVGPSGSGKTTLFDLVLGILSPTSGTITISGENARDAILKWPGAIGYVPQEIYLSNSTIAQNVALGFDLKEISDIEIWRALKEAQLSQFVSSRIEGLSTNLGGRGIKISGGQKQRLGIARALLTKPRILLLDEATSALDSQTEHEVSEAIDSLKGDVTLLCIAHRLSTAKRADRVIYLEAGKMLAQGSFEEVKAAVPNFHNQAQLMDLG